ncbi:MAG: hypothetical protein LH609_10850 [Rudanella sp.]|nr:hypothetical protein [Rudanella sp.]
MKPFWIRKAAKFFFFALLLVALTGWVVMSLWNALLPTILGVTTITFWQALGLLVLSRILFGGWGRGGGGWQRGGPRQQHWKEKMTERWQTLTPEQREQMKARWKDRC